MRATPPAVGSPSAAAAAAEASGAIDPSRYLANVSRLEGELWVADRAAAVSYPSDGYEKCFQLEESSFWFAHRNRCIRSVVRQFPPNGPILDVGAGNGFVALCLTAAGFQVLPLEAGMAGARNALSRGLKPVVCAGLEEAGLRAKSVPAIALFDVLEHVEADVDFLRHLHGGLIDGGRLYLTVPAFRLLWSDEDVRAGHFRRYRVATLSDALRRAGFEVDFATYFFALLPLPIFFARTLRSRLRVRPRSTQASYRREHLAGSGSSHRLLDALLGWEVRCLDRRRRVPIGASCLVVARRATAAGVG